MIELFCGLAIIGILAAIAIPNFLEAQIRSKTSRARMELMGLKVALGDYYGFWHGYPPPIKAAGSDEEEKPSPANRRIVSLEQLVRENRAYVAQNAYPRSATAPGVPPTPPPTATPRRSPGRGSLFFGYAPYVSNDPWEKYPSPLNALTTPVPFVSSLPNDPFHKSPMGFGPYKYHPHLGEEAGGLSINVPGHNGSFLFTLWSYGPDLSGNTLFTPDLTSILAYDPSNGTTSSGDLLISGP